MSINTTIGIAGSGTGTTDAFDPIFASNAPVETLTGVVASGQGILPTFTVLGKVTATGKYVKSVASASDGSQIPVRVLGFEVDATSADRTAGMFVAGCFNVEALVFDASFDTDAKKLAAFSSGTLLVKKLGPAN